MLNGPLLILYTLEYYTRKYIKYDTCYEAGARLDFGRVRKIQKF
jgi:hypothetical protein